jgi:hypothetical protein
VDGSALTEQTFLLFYGFSIIHPPVLVDVDVVVGPQQVSLANGWGGKKKQNSSGWEQCQKAKKFVQTNFSTTAEKQWYLKSNNRLEQQTTV